MEELQAKNIPSDQKMTDWGLSQTYEIHKWEEKRKEGIRLENQLKEEKELAENRLKELQAHGSSQFQQFKEPKLLEVEEPIFIEISSDKHEKRKGR